MNNEKNALENEKKTLQIHTEELIRILTHLNTVKPEKKKKKSLVWNKSGQKQNKPENKTKFSLYLAKNTISSTNFNKNRGENDKSKNLGSSF